jgi:tetraacyldisaccharide 4'-kinase
MLKKTELYFKGVISGKRQGFCPWLIRNCLLPISWVYRLSSAWRNWLYDQNIMRCYVPPVSLVISIGNIVAGGTGKTPVTIMLAKIFYEKYEMAILSRGYRSKAENLDMPTVLCDGHGPMFPASYCGDEPYIYAQYFPKAHVIVGNNRKKASKMASKAGVQVLLLDDALQHRRLARDFDIIVVDLNDPFGQNHFLPRGFLREDVRALRRAHLIILNHATENDQFKKIEKEVKKISAAPIIGTRYQISQIIQLNGEEIPTLQGKTVGFFCSIAHPEYFKRLLENEGAWVAAEYCLADHDEIKEKALAHFATQCFKKGCEVIVCTEKDRVKLKGEMSLDLPIVCVRIELQIVEGQDEWQKFVNTLLSKV